MTWLLACSVAWALGDEVRACLANVDVPCAERAVLALGGRTSTNAEVLSLVAEVDFFAGRFPLALEARTRSEAISGAQPSETLALYERTTFATAGWHVVAGGRFDVRYRPGPDAVLVAETLLVLASADRALTALIGEPPPGRTAVELYPDTKTFIAASSFMVEDVYTTGVVALSKWSRLLVTSPRSHGTGYGWRDTITHEYIHLLVSHATSDRAPVWLQEGIARYLETRWVDGTDRFEHGPRAEGLLAEALARDAFIPFKSMNPSLAKLPSREAAALAYAQLASLVSFAFERGGDDVLVDTLADVRSGTEAGLALAQASGFADFPGLEAAWKTHLRGLNYRRTVVAEPAVALDGGDDLAADPVLAKREDLGRWLTLGDLLGRHGHHEAALVEYGRAVPEDAPGPSPVVAVRMAEAHSALGRVEPAEALLRATLLTYPEVADSWMALAMHLRSRGDVAGALSAWEAGLDLDPFDVGAREFARDAAIALSQGASTQRHQSVLDVLTGEGADDAGDLLHNHIGVIVLPSYGSAEGLVGKRAPPTALLDLSGLPFRIPSGSPILLDFWATWCGPCRKSMPEIERLSAAYKAQGLVVVGASDEDAPVIKSFLSRPGAPAVTYPLIVDPDGATKKRYGISSLPTVVVIGRDGVVVDVVVGAGADARDRIEAAVLKAVRQRS